MSDQTQVQTEGGAVLSIEADGLMYASNQALPEHLRRQMIGHVIERHLRSSGGDGYGLTASMVRAAADLIEASPEHPAPYRLPSEVTDLDMIVGLTENGFLLLGHPAGADTEHFDTSQPVHVVGRVEDGLFFAEPFAPPLSPARLRALADLIVADGQS